MVVFPLTPLCLQLHSPPTNQCRLSPAFISSSFRAAVSSFLPSFLAPFLPFPRPVIYIYPLCSTHIGTSCRRHGFIFHACQDEEVCCYEERVSLLGSRSALRRALLPPSLPSCSSFHGSVLCITIHCYVHVSLDRSLARLLRASLAVVVASGERCSAARATKM